MLLTCSRSDKGCRGHTRGATVRTTGLPQDVTPASCLLDTPQPSPVLWLFFIFFPSMGRREDLWQEREREERGQQTENPDKP